MNPKSTLKEARDVIIKDVLFSLKNRLEILSEEMPLKENPFLINPNRFSWQLPKRVFFTVSNCILSSYVSVNQDLESIQAYVIAIASVKPLYIDSREFHLKVESLAKPVTIEKLNLSEKDKMKFMIVAAIIFAMLLVSFLFKAYR